MHPGTNTFLDWVTQSVNWLIGQAVPLQPGLPAVQNNNVNPTSSQIPSVGNRLNSITSPIIWTATTTSITFYWDGTNGSTPLTIYRDDNTIEILAVGNLTVTGLTANTTYLFYPFYQELTTDNPTSEVVGVHFVSFPGAVGTPPIAFTAANLLAAQRQTLRDHISLSVLFATTGIATPASGTGGGSGGSGGGGGSGGKRYFQ